MKLRNFVSASSVLLAGWLLVTFLHEVPAQNYPKLRKYPATAKVLPANTTPPEVAMIPAPEDFAVSASH